jgi:biopolymer transport protein TolR
MGVAVEAPGKKKGARPDINITPLVDIVLVLLIIFMVITPQLEAGESVEPPHVTNVDPSSKSKLDVLTLTYTSSGKYFVEKDQLAGADAFAQRLEAEYAKNAARRVMLKGDYRTEYGRMRDVFNVVQKAGFKGVSLVVAQKAGSDPSDPAYVAGVP